MRFNRVSNDTTIVNEVFRQITEAIVQGTIKPGDKIPTELELMDEFGVGRNSIREAIKMLCAMGVLEVKRGSGTFVNREASPAVLNPLIFSLILDQKAAGDLYELHFMFKTMVLLVVIDKIAEDGIFDLEQLLEKSQQLYARKETSSDELIQMDLAFQHRILEYTYNPLIQRLGKAIMELFPVHTWKTLLLENGIEHCLDNHRMVVEAIRGKDKLKVLSCRQSGVALEDGENCVHLPGV